MGKLLIVDDLYYSSFEVTFQKYIEIFAINLFVNLINNFFENEIHEWILALSAIVLFKKHIYELVINIFVFSV